MPVTDNRVRDADHKRIDREENNEEFPLALFVRISVLGDVEIRRRVPSLPNPQPAFLRSLVFNRHERAETEGKGDQHRTNRERQWILNTLNTTHPDAQTTAPLRLTKTGLRSNYRDILTVLHHHWTRCTSEATKARLLFIENFRLVPSLVGKVGRHILADAEIHSLRARLSDKIRETVRTGSSPV